MKLFFFYITTFVMVVSVFLGACEALCPALRSADEKQSSGIGEALRPTRISVEKISRSRVFANGRISGGQNTTPNEFPWQAYIRSTFWSGDIAICGGSLISDEWVMSAAHCFYGAAGITVILGEHDTSTDSDDNYRQVFDVSPRNVKSYPSWFYPDLEGDIALVPLPFKASINNYVSPISLPYTNEDSSFENSLVVLTGWGNFSSVPDSGLSPKLQKTSTSVLGSLGLNADCQREAGLAFDGAKIICGDGKNSHRFCYGDDGGPMNYYRAEENDWVVVGVATTGDPSTNCSSSIKPSLYTRVSYYLDWIHNVTQIPPRVRTTTTSTTTTVMPTTTRVPLNYCRELADGYYPIPGETCTKYFIECRDGTAYILECLELETVFYADYCWCDYAFNVPGCPTYTALPSF